MLPIVLSMCTYLLHIYVVDNAGVRLLSMWGCLIAERKFLERFYDVHIYVELKRRTVYYFCTFYLSFWIFMYNVKYFILWIERYSANGFSIFKTSFYLSVWFWHYVNRWETIDLLMLELKLLK